MNAHPLRHSGRRARVAAVLLLTALLGSVAPPGAAADSVSPDASAEASIPDQVDEFLAGFVAESGVPGVSVAITQDTEVLHVTGVGRGSDGEPVTASTPMRVASLSKSFTALAVMRLVEEGEVDLDRPVRAYLPEFTLDDPRVEDVTVRHLLNHTSGMADSEFPDERRGGPTNLEEFVAGMRDAGLAAEPGTQSSYHNPNYHVAARLVEVVSGEPIDAYLRRHVLDPLGMESSLMLVTYDQAVPGLADGHVWAYGRAFPAPEPGGVAAGPSGVVTTAEDMARWLVMQGNGGAGADGTRVVSPESIAEMHRPQGPGDEPDDGHGLGWVRMPPADGRGPVRTSHGGAGPTYGAYQGLFTESGGYGIAVMFNAGVSLTGPQPSDVSEGLTAILGIEEPRPRDTPPALAVDLGLTALALVSAALGVLGVARSGRWARRRAGSPWWRTAVGLLPGTAVVALVLSVPAYVSNLFGRAVSWQAAAFAQPVLTAWLAVAALAAALVLAVRVVRLIRTLRSRGSGAAAR